MKVDNVPTTVSETFQSSFPWAPCGRLPNELLLLIKDNIPVSDLRTHVCFYHTCRTIAGFYGDASEQADFWRRSCLLSGITFCRSDSSYKDVAFECIAKDGFCSHPQCGGSLLDWNAKQVEEAMRRTGWDPEDGPWDAGMYDRTALLKPENVSSFPIPVPNRVLGSIAFNKFPRPPMSIDTADGFLRSYETEGPWPYIDHLIVNHPIAWRSFATFPSLERFMIFYGGGDGQYGDMCEVVQSGTVVNVRTLMNQIKESLDDDLYVSQLLELLSGPFKNLDINGPESFSETLLKRSNLRLLWSMSRWDGLQLGTIGMGGAMFRLCFSPLPAKTNEKILDR